MWELVTAGGWLMIVIMLCSVIALAISLERLYALKRERVVPQHLPALVWKQLKARELDTQRLRQLRGASPLGRILATAVANAHLGREVMKDCIEEAANHVALDLERYLNTLGTIAVIAPLLGLLGTVVGMIRVFAEIMAQGTGNASALAGGISEALITTAAGLSVAIPALAMHRFLTGRVDQLVVELEQQAIRLVDVLHAEGGEPS